MGILKRKLALAQQNGQNNLETEPLIKQEEVVETLEPHKQSKSPEPIQRRLRNRASRIEIPKTLTPKGSTSCKNIMKNYSRVFTVFALSPMALPYLRPLLESQKLELPFFLEFIESRKRAANCISGLRDLLLLVTEDDSKEVAEMKIIFQKICVIFLKFFCLNWLYNGKIVDRIAHLRYRLKMLRRVLSPAEFTHLLDYAK